MLSGLLRGTLLVILAAAPALSQSLEPSPSVEEMQLPPDELGGLLLQGESLLLGPAPLTEGAPQGSILDRYAPPPRAAGGDWISKIRYRLARLPWRTIGLAAAGLVPLLAIAVTFALRRRRARQRLRTQRSAGGTQPRTLSEVVAAVQFVNRTEQDRPLSADLRRLNEGVALEAGSANPGVGTRPTSVEVPIDL